MKIAFLIGRLGEASGGLEKTTVRLAKAFADRSCDVTILTTGKSSLPAVSLGKTLRPTYRHLLAFDAACKKWLQKNPSEIVFGMERNTLETHLRAGSGVHAAYLKQRALVDPFFKRLSHAFNPLHRTLLKLEKSGFENPLLEQIFTNSHMVKNEIVKHYDVAADKIAVVHNGAPFVEWKEAFETTPFVDGPFRFLFVGHGFRRKGLHFLLEALSLLLGNWRLSVVGKDKEMFFFQDLANKLKIEQKVTFHGPQNDMIPFYQASDALVIPSIYDPFANVTTEALAMELFVVSSRFNGGHEVLNGDNGVVIEELTEAESFKKALERSLERPKIRFSAEKIRNSVAELDLSRQFEIIVSKTLRLK